MASLVELVRKNVEDRPLLLVIGVAVIGEGIGSF
jgi:hypothetical protein